MRKCVEVCRLQYEKKNCIILAWKTHVRIGWKYSKTCDEGTPLYPGQSVPTWQVPSSQVCPNNMKTPYFKMIIPYFIHFILILSPNNTWWPSYPHKSTFENYYIILLLCYRSFGKMLIFCWQLVHVARNPGISNDLLFSSFWNITWLIMSSFRLFMF